MVGDGLTTLIKTVHFPVQSTDICFFFSTNRLFRVRPKMSLIISSYGRHQPTTSNVSMPMSDEERQALARKLDEDLDNFIKEAEAKSAPREKADLNKILEVWTVI